LEIGLDFVRGVVRVLEEKKGEDILVLDMREVSVVADYFILVSGTSPPHLKALSREVEEYADKNNIRLLRHEGYRGGNWLLLDYGNIVIHFFDPQTRQFYNLEWLWGDARRLELNETETGN